MVSFQNDKLLLNIWIKTWRTFIFYSRFGSDSRTAKDIMLNSGIASGWLQSENLVSAGSLVQKNEKLFYITANILFTTVFLNDHIIHRTKKISLYMKPLQATTFQNQINLKPSRTTTSINTHKTSNLIEISLTDQNLWHRRAFSVWYL